MQIPTPLFELEEDTFAFREPAFAESTRARAGRALYTPALTPAAEWLLLNTEPPKPELDLVTSRTSNDDEVKQVVRKLRKLSVRKLIWRAALRSAGREGIEGKHVFPEAALLDFRERLDSKSPMDLLPKTWDEYTSLYASGKINIDDPPLPPTQRTASLFPSRVFPSSRNSPFEAGHYPAPRSTELEDIRQKALFRVDLFGQKLFPSGRPLDSMRDHPNLIKLVDRAKRLFKTRVVVISVLTNYQQVFLAASGLPEGVEQWPRPTTYCGHTILSEDADGPKELVVVDTKKDWRFKNSVLSTVMGTRFYAGVPICISAITARVSGTRPTAIGTVAIMDNHPRVEFDIDARNQLALFAREVESEIEFWIAKERFAPPETPSIAPSAPLAYFSLPTPLATKKPVSPPLSLQMSFSPTPQANTNRWSTGSTFLPNTTQTAQAVETRRSSIGSAASIRSPLPSAMTTFPPPSSNDNNPRRVSFVARAPNRLSFPRRVDFPDTPPTDDFFPNNHFPSKEESIPLPDSPPESRRPSVEDEENIAAIVQESAYAAVEEESDVDKEEPQVAQVEEEADEEIPASPVPSNSTVLPAPIPFPSPSPLSLPRRPPPSPTRMRYSPFTPSTSPVPTLQQIFDLALQTIGQGLSLSLVYLITIKVSPPSQPTISLQSIYISNSIHASTLPKFDPAIHLKALSAKSGGLVYLNPKKDRHENDSGYESGLLVPCWSDGKGGGMVIGGFTKDRTRRNFTKAEMKVFKEVGRRVEQFIRDSKVDEVLDNL